MNLPSVNELSQMFPKLDGDLGSVASHFRFDHLSPANADNVSEGVDSAEVKTPLQATNEFSARTNDQTADEKDDEPTLSTDCLANQNNSKSEGIVSAATKLLEDIINNSAPKQQTESLIDSARGPWTRGSNSQIRKQTSLHGSESTVSVSSLRQSSNMGTPDSFHRFPRRNIEYSRFMSVDQRSISDTEDNVTIDSSNMKCQDASKTQSCANIQLSCTAPRSPGTIVVKEKYIELPKQKAQSIRTSKTAKDLQELAENTKKSVSLTSSAESVTKLGPKGASTKPRFTTTKVDETELGASVLKEV